MEVPEAVNFLFILIFFLWLIKADFFFILFSLSVYLFMIFYLYASNPTESLMLIVNDIIVNPSPFILPFIPIVIYIFVKFMRKRIGKYKNKNLMKTQEK